MTKVGVSVFALSFAACGVGDDTTHTGVTTTNDALGIVCSDSLTTTGTFQIGTVCSDTGTSCGAAGQAACNGGASCTATQPASALGCYPVGTWTFSAALSGSETCASPIQLLPSYAVVITESVDGSGDPLQSAAYTTDPTTHAHVKVSSGGGGLCEGDFVLFSADGTEQWNFTPDLNADNSITGKGLYRVYNSDQWGDGT